MVWRYISEYISYPIKIIIYFENSLLQLIAIIVIVTVFFL